MLNHGLATPPLNGLNLRRTVDWGPSWLKKTDMPDWKVADFIVEELAKPHDRPRFLACGFYLPHLPWYVPQEYLDRYPLDQVPLPPVKEDDLDDIGPYAKRFALGEGLPKPDDPDDYGSGKGIFETIKTSGKWREAVRAYLASISFADDCLGRVLDALESSPGGRETIVCLWSDHGWHLGEKQHWEKVTLWEEATRSVLMISAPGMQRGRSSQRVVNIMDLHPTLLELCALPACPDLDCRSLVPLLKNPEETWDHPTLTTHGRGNHAVRDERYRYIRYRNGEEELYDHTRDANEWTNLAADPAQRPIIESLRRHLPKEEAPAIGPEFPAKK
jgi:arylsulfatase A-like enzyme